MDSKQENPPPANPGQEQQPIPQSSSAAPLSSGVSSSTPLPQGPAVPIPAQGPLDPESTDGDTPLTSDTDSAFGDDATISSYTTSLLSEVRNYRYENNRRYHSYREGSYVLPNDEAEQDRQDLLHHVRNLVLDSRLFLAPLPPNPQRVLDIGTGTGIWAIDFADQFPNSEVIGTDLSPIQPSWVPPNLHFEVDDAESEWLFNVSKPFDYIHTRDLGGSIGDWPKLIQQSYRHLRPGGWLELQEFEVTLKSDDDTLKLAPNLCEFIDKLHVASEMFKKPMNIAESHKDKMIAAGFEDVRDDIFKVSQTTSSFSSGYCRF
jgi:SAM-dependent methyltransferase